MSKTDSTSFINPESWVSEHGDYLFNYAVSRVNNKTTAEDLVQETFLSALKNYKNFKQNSSERTWFTSILKNKIIDYYRKTSGKTVNDDEENRVFENSFDENEKWKSEFAPVDWGENPELAFEQVEFMEILKECITALPKKLAGIFTSREIDNKKSEIICKELNISLSNLWVMLYRARSQLRRCLELNWFA